MTTFKTPFSAALIALFMILAAPSSVQAADKINTLDKGVLFGYKESGIAIRGYDTVAYFTQSKPIKGKDKFSTDWNGAKWKFSSQEHLDLFKNDPEKYAPQYGGYCAYGVAMDYLVKIEPDLWTIIDDKLYLNYDNNIQNKWEKDIGGFISAANEKFESLLLKN